MSEETAETVDDLLEAMQKAWIALDNLEKTMLTKYEGWTFGEDENAGSILTYSHQVCRRAIWAMKNVIKSDPESYPTLKSKTEQKDEK